MQEITHPTGETGHVEGESFTPPRPIAKIAPDVWIDGTVEFRKNSLGDSEALEIYYEFYARSNVVYTVESEIRAHPSSDYRANTNRRFDGPILDLYFIRNGWRYDAPTGYAWPISGPKLIVVTIDDLDDFHTPHYRLRLREHEAEDRPDTMQAAPQIPLDEYVLGTTPNGDADWFAFDAPAIGVFGVLSQHSRRINFDTDLFDSRGIELSRLGSWWEIPEPGRYWLKIMAGWDFPFVYRFAVTYAVLKEDDHGDTVSTATAIAPNTSQPHPYGRVNSFWDNDNVQGISETVATVKGWIEHDGDTDVFAIQAEKGAKYRLVPTAHTDLSFRRELSNSLELELLNDDLRVMSHDALEPLVGFVASESGVYHFKVRDRQHTGFIPEGYQIDLLSLPPDDVTDIRDDATVIGDGQLLTGTLNTFDDMDWFRIMGSEGQSWRFQSERTFPGCITIFGIEPATILARRCNLSGITLTVPRTGEYGIKFSSSRYQTLYEEHDRNYEYTVRLAEPDDHSDAGSLGTRLSDGVTYSGAIDYPGDIDAFVIPVQADEIWEITVSNTGSAFGYVSEFVAASAQAPDLVTLEEWEYRRQEWEYRRHHGYLRAHEAGRWIIRMAQGYSEYKPAAYGYNLSARRLDAIDDYGDNRSNSHAIPTPTLPSEICADGVPPASCGDTVSIVGELEHPCDRDVFKVYLDSDRIYRFRVTSAGDNVNFDLRQADDLEPHDELVWSWRHHPWRPTLSGDYWIYVYGDIDDDIENGTGSYTLEAMAVEDDVTLPLDLAIDLELGTVYQVGSEGDGGRNLYRVQLDHPNYVLEIDFAHHVHYYSAKPRYDRYELVLADGMLGASRPWEPLREPLNQYIYSSEDSEIFFKVVAGQESSYSVLVREYVLADRQEYHLLEILGHPAVSTARRC